LIIGAIGAVVVGIIGGLIGGWILDALDVATGLTFIGAIVVAIVGAVAILYAMRATNDSPRL